RVTVAQRRRPVPPRFVKGQSGNPSGRPRGKRSLATGIKINTSPSAYFPIKQMQLQRFDGTRWVRFGEVMGARVATRVSYDGTLHVFGYLVSPDNPSFALQK